MPLPRYGVVIGTLVRFYRDPPDDFGRWYHGHVEVSTASGLWTSALDVDTPTGVGVSYRTSSGFVPGILGEVSTLPDGFHFLPSNSTSGALDYLRSPFLQDRHWPARYVRPRGLPAKPDSLPPTLHLAADARPFPRPKLFRTRMLHQYLLRTLQFVESLFPGRMVRFRPWLRSDGENALKALEAELVGTRKVFIFGDRFSGPERGVHDVHQNQGDPAGSPWWNSNGVWQDGAVIVQRPDGTLFVWQVRFNSQATRTDADGHPV